MHSKIRGVYLEKRAEEGVSRETAGIAVSLSVSFALFLLFSPVGIAEKEGGWRGKKKRRVGLCRVCYGLSLLLPSSFHLALGTSSAPAPVGILDWSSWP